MLVSPVNQSLGSDQQSRTAPLLVLEFDDQTREPVLLTTGKWTLGSADSSRVLLKDTTAASCQWLIVVTELKAIIRDWTGESLLNGSPFHDAVLRDGDTLTLDDLRIAVRSTEEASDEPVVDSIDGDATNDSHTEVINEDCLAGSFEPDAQSIDTPARASFEPKPSEDRLDILIGRVEGSLASLQDSPAGDTPTGVRSTHESTTENSSAPSLDSEQARASDLDLALGIGMGDGDREPLTYGDVAEDRFDDSISNLGSQNVSPGYLCRDGESEALAESSQCSVLEVVEEPEHQFSLDPAMLLGDAEANLNDDEDREPEQESDSTPYETDSSLIAAEREKLRRIVDDFDGSSISDSDLPLERSDSGSPLSEDEAEADFPAEENNDLLSLFPQEETADDAEEDAEFPLTVGATSILGENSVSNAMRSRDDALRQLDELVLAATGGTEIPDPPPITDAAVNQNHAGDLPKSGEDSTGSDAFHHGHDDSESEPESGLDGEIETEGETCEEALHDRLDEADKLASFEYETDGSPDENTFPDTTLPLTDAESLAEEASIEDDVEAESPSSRDTVQVGEPTAEDTVELRSLSDVVIPKDSDTAAPQHDDQLTVREETAAEGAETAVAVESEQSDDSNTASWFDSELSTAGRFTEQPSDAYDTNETDTSGEENTGQDSTQELRSRLAEMFDLPGLNGADEEAEPGAKAGDSSDAAPVETSHLERQSADSAGAEDISPSSGGVLEAFGISNSGLENPDSEAITDSADENFEDETLDHFPEPVSPRQSSEEPEAGTSSDEDEDASDEMSISAYMENLLARNRRQAGVEAAPTEASPQAPAEDRSPSSTLPAGSTQNSPSDLTTVQDEAGQDETWFEQKPRHRQDKDQVRAEVQALRQVANQSARTAVATAGRKQLRLQICAKTIAAILALGSGIAALLLDVSAIFGIVVMGIGLVFSFDLGLTIFRNWKQLSALRKGKRALAEDSSGDVTRREVPAQEEDSGDLQNSAESD